MKCSVNGCERSVAFRGMCRPHYDRKRRTGSTDPKPVKSLELLAKGMAYCSHCKKEKPASDFRKDRTTTTGLTRYCGDCNRVKSKARYHNGDKRALLLKKYGMSVADYNAMLDKQFWLCAICGRCPKRPLFVDHDHKTGSVRGLLCSDCNLGLGAFKDSQSNLSDAIDYLNGVFFCDTVGV